MSILFPNFDWLKDSPHQRLLALLTQEKGEARFVGSAVRDSLLGLPIKDFDLATTHTPPDMMRILTNAGIKVIPTGIAFGTVTALLGEIVYEITTLREDTKTDGRHAEVLFTIDWVCDSKRRDFTINALYLDSTGKIYDFQGGLEDLRAGRVCFIGDPETRIREDYLRILRFFRFSAFYAEGTLDTSGLEACQKLRNNISTLSSERITHEFLRLLEAPYPWRALEAMVQIGVLEPVLGQAKDDQILYRIDGIWLLEDRLGEKFSPLFRLKGLFPQTEPPAKLRLTRQEKKKWRTLGGDEKNSFLDLSEKIAYGHIAPEEAARLFRESQTLFQQKRDTPFPLKGDDLIALGGVPGKAFGELLEETRQWWEQQDPRPSRERCLQDLRERLLHEKDLAKQREGEGTSK